MMPVALWAQLPYELTVLNQPYAPLENATALGSEQYDDDAGLGRPRILCFPGF